MQIPRLTMTSQFARLGLQIDKPVQTIEQPRAEIEQSQPQAKVEVRRTQPRLTIDQTEAWASMERKNPLRIMEDAAREGMQAIQEGIARRASEGSRLMRIESGEDVAKNIAVELALPPPREMNVRFLLGRFGVEYSIEQGTTDIDVETSPPTFDVQVKSPIHEYERGKVTGVMEQYASLTIDVEA